MLDLVRSSYIKAYLDSIKLRAERAAESLDWLDGEQLLVAHELVPPFDKGSEGETTWLRLSEQVQSIGPRAYRFKRNGALGGVNWGGKNVKDIDARLEDIDLQDLATQALKALMGPGIVAMWAYLPGTVNEEGVLVPSGQAPKIQRLGGHIEPLYAEDDGAGDVVALYQVRANPHTGYTIRIYAFGEEPGTGTIYEWQKASEMYALAKDPIVLENTTVPRFQMAGRSQDGLPLGEFTQALPLVKGELATQLRILRTADTHAWPLLYLFGANIDSQFIGTQRVITGGQGASAGRIDPGSLDVLFQQQERLMERLRSDLSLPINSIQGGSWPSGEALAQANAVYLSSCRDYANMIGRLLTQVVEDYAVLLGLSREQAPPVSVSVNQEHAREALTKQVRDDHTAGLITIRAAVLAISPFYPHWDDDEVEAFILRKEEEENKEPQPVPPALAAFQAGAPQPEEDPPAEEDPEEDEDDEEEPE